MSYSYQNPLPGSYGSPYGNQEVFVTNGKKSKNATGAVVCGALVGATAGGLAGYVKNPLVSKSGIATDNFTRNVYETYIKKGSNPLKNAYEQGNEILKKIDKTKTVKDLKDLFNNNKDAAKELCDELKINIDEYFKNINDKITDTISAIGNDNHIAFNPNIFPKIYAKGIITINCLAKAINKLNIPWPKACNTVNTIIVKPPNKKLILIIFKAGTPMLIISLEALNNISNSLENSWKITSPTNIIDTAYIILSFIVFINLFLFLAPKLYATIGTIPLFIPNIGIYTKLWSLKYIPKTAVAVGVYIINILFNAKVITEVIDDIIIDGIPTA